MMPIAVEMNGEGLFAYILLSKGESEHISLVQIQGFQCSGNHFVAVDYFGREHALFLEPGVMVWVVQNKPIWIEPNGAVVWKYPNNEGT